MELYYALRDWSADFDCTDSPAVDIYASLQDAKDKFYLEMNSAITDAAEMFCDSERVEEKYIDNLDSGSEFYSVYQSDRWS